MGCKQRDFGGGRFVEERKYQFGKFKGRQAVLASSRPSKATGTLNCGSCVGWEVVVEVLVGSLSGVGRAKQTRDRDHVK